MEFETLMELMDKDYIFSYFIMESMMKMTMLEYEIKKGITIIKNGKGFNKIAPFFHMMIEKYNSYGRLEVSEYIRIQKRMKKYHRQLKELFKDDINLISYLLTKNKKRDFEDNERHGCTYGICDECPYECSI